MIAWTRSKIDSVFGRQSLLVVAIEGAVSQRVVSGWPGSVFEVIWMASGGGQEERGAREGSPSIGCDQGRSAARVQTPFGWLLDPVLAVESSSRRRWPLSAQFQKGKFCLMETAGRSVCVYERNAINMKNRAQKLAALNVTLTVAPTTDFPNGKVISRAHGCTTKGCKEEKQFWKDSSQHVRTSSTKYEGFGRRHFQ